MDTVFKASKANTERIITVINTNTQQIIDNTNTNVIAIMNKFQELRQDIRDEFIRLGDSFNTIIEEGMMVMIHGHEKCLEGLDCLKHQLEQQRNQSTLDMDAIRGSFDVLGTKLSSRLDHSLSAILVASSKDTSSSTSEDINNRLNVLITMVSNVKEQVSTFSKYLRDIRSLTSKIAQKQTHYPYTFVILPKSTVDKMMSTEPSSSSSVFKFVKKKIINFYQALLWDQSVLLFICPVSLKIMICGRKGRGYNIKLPTSSLKTIVPALRWGLFFLKAGLATQGLGSVVPDLASILPVIDDAYIRSIETAIVSSVQPALDLTKIDNFDQVLNQTLDSITDEQDQAAFNFLADFLMKKEKYQGTNIQEWEPQYTGLHKEVSEYDGSCMWVSEESKQEFLKRGLDAIKMKGVK